MDALLVKLFGEALSGLLCAVVGVVYDDLAAALEKVPDELLAAIGDALAEGHGLGGLFACDRVSDGGCEEGPRTEGKVVGREGLCAAEGLSAIVAEGDDVCLYAHPPQIALEGARDVGLSAGRQSDGEDEDLARMPQQSRRSRVQRGRHQCCSQKLVITSCKVCYRSLSERNRGSIVLHLLVELRERLFHPSRPLFLSASGGDGEWRTAWFACTARVRVASGNATGCLRCCSVWRVVVRQDRQARATEAAEQGWLCLCRSGAYRRVCRVHYHLDLYWTSWTGISGRLNARREGHLRPSINLPSYLARATAASPDRWNATTAIPFERPWEL